jgi:fucose 4-O-acetylase-like acetyltransferase
MRIKEIDILKGVLIFFVILGHSTFEYSREIYWFHMPAFFMVSGFLFSPQKATLNVIPFLKKKSVSLIIPYVTFLICVSVFSLLLLDGSVFNLKFFAKLIFGGKLLANEFGVFWFITSLLFTIFIFTFLYKKIENKTLLLFSVIICFVIAHLESSIIHQKKYDIYFPLNLDTAFLGVVYFYIGFLFKSYFQYFKETIIRNRFISTILSISLAASVFLWVEGFNFDMKYQNYGNVVFSLIIPVSITMVLLSLIVLLPKINFIDELLMMMGRYSLLIMYLHLLIKYILIKYEAYNLILFVALSIVIPVVLSKLFERNKYTSLLFLGIRTNFKTKL